MLSVLERVSVEDRKMKEKSPIVTVPGHQTPFLCNKEAFAELQKENELLALGWVVTITTAISIGTAMTVPLVAPGVAGAAVIASKWTEWRAGKVLRLLYFEKPLLEKFQSEGVEIYPRIPVDGMNPIDLFIRFPQRTHLFISIRSKGKTEIAYNETRETLHVRRRNGSFSLWEPNPLVELADYKTWLDKNRALFGMSSREAQKTPTAKVLLLWPPTKADKHKEELYSEIGSLKALVLRRKGSAFVIQQEDLLNFVTAWLAKYE